MTAPYLIRRYRPEDRAECLALFESNMPTFFVEKERTMFAEFLDGRPGNYLVLEDSEGCLVAAGGMALIEGGEVSICWAFVDARKRGQSLIGVLFRVGLALAARLPGAVCLGFKTSMDNLPILAKEGWYVVREIHDYFRPSVHLRCDLDEACRARIESRLADALAQGHRMEEGLLTVV